MGGCEYTERDDPGNLQFDWLEVQLDRYRDRGLQVRAVLVHNFYSVILVLGFYSAFRARNLLIPPPLPLRSISIPFPTRSLLALLPLHVLPRRSGTASGPEGVGAKG